MNKEGTRIFFSYKEKKEGERNIFGIKMIKIKNERF